MCVCVCADVLRWWQLAGVKGFPAVLDRRSFELKAVISSPFIFPPAERKKGLPQRPASMSAVEFEKPFSGSQMFCQVRVKVNWIHIRIWMCRLLHVLQLSCDRATKRNDTSERSQILCLDFVMSVSDNYIKLKADLFGHSHVWSWGEVIYMPEV